MEYKVLVADDEQSIRESIKRFLGLLTSDGYQLQIYVASNGAEALQIISEHTQQVSGIDLVISDVNMPVKTGLDVLIEGQNVSPSTKFILLSGRMGEYREQVEARGAKVLGKPFTFDALLEATKASLPHQTQQK